MGEKGNELDQGLAVVAAAAPAGAVADSSVVERVTSVTTQTLVGTGKDALSSIKDKMLDEGVDATFEEARQRLVTPSPPVDDATAPASDGPPDEGGTDDGMPRT